MSNENQNPCYRGIDWRSTLVLRGQSSVFEPNSFAFSPPPPHGYNDYYDNSSLAVHRAMISFLTFAIRAFLRCGTIVFGAMLVGLAICSIYEIDDPEHRIIVVGICVSVSWSVDIWFIRGKVLADLQRCLDEDEREWSDALYARPVKTDG
jgi:hypothetical protein